MIKTLYLFLIYIKQKSLLVSLWSQLWQLNTINVYCWIRNIRLKRYTWLVGNSDWAKINKRYQTLAHTFSLVSLDTEFVKLLKWVRLGSVWKRFEHAYRARLGLALLPLAPLLITIRIKKLTNKACRGNP